MRPTLVLLSLLLIASTTFAGWSSSGPLGGAVNAVVVAPSNPAVIWAGSAAGVFRSTDGGATWSNVSGPLADVARLVVHPKDADKAWALSSSQGLWRTVDGGATWISSNTFAGIMPTALLIDPRDPDTLYVAGNCLAGVEPIFLPWNGVHKSTDGGVTWKSLPAVGGLSLCVQELAIDPFSPWRLFTASAYGGHLETYDRAQTWQSPDGPRPSLAVVFDPRYPFTHYGISRYPGSSFLVSQDGGFTWSKSAASPPAQVQSLTMDPERGRLFLGTSNGLFRSGDGGRTWAKTALQDVNVGALDFGGTPAAVFAATNQGLFALRGRGVADSQTIDLHQIATYPWALDIDPSDPNVLYTSTSDWASAIGGTPAHGSVFRSAEGGASWEHLPADDRQQRRWQNPPPLRSPRS